MKRYVVKMNITFNVENNSRKSGCHEAIFFISLALYSFYLSLSFYLSFSFSSSLFKPPILSSLSQRYHVFLSFSLALSFIFSIIIFLPRNVLMRGGNAVEAAVAGMFCLCGIEPQSAGIGGGLIMTLHKKFPVLKTTLHLAL